MLIHLLRRYLLGWLRPILEDYGFSNPDQFFVQHLLEAARRTGRSEVRLLSIGAETAILKCGLHRRSAKQA